MKLVMDALQISKTLKRMTHEIIEQNSDLNDVVLVGILKKGVPIAKILKENIKRFADLDLDLFELDISGHRDDEKVNPNTMNNLHVKDKHVILVDDVLFTGRTIRAAMDALIDFGRPKTIKLAVLIDRGHKELPIRADYVGKNIPTSKKELVLVDLNLMEVKLTETPI